MKLNKFIQFHQKKPMSQQDKTVPAYLVVYQFIDPDEKPIRLHVKSAIFLKSTINHNDISWFCRIKILNLLYYDIRFDNGSLQEPENACHVNQFSDTHRLKIICILEKLYRADYFDERGEFLDCDSKQISSARQEPFSLIDSIGKEVLLIIFSQSTIEKYETECPHFIAFDEYPRDVEREKTFQEMLVFAWLESLFDTYVPFCPFDSCFEPHRLEDGITNNGIIKCKYSDALNDGEMCWPLTMPKNLPESFAKIKALLAPRLDFANLVLYDVDG